MNFGRSAEQTRSFYRQIQERVGQLPGVERVALGSAVPWRDAGDGDGSGFRFRVDGETRSADNEDARAKMRSISPGYFETMGARLVAGRDFNAEDRDAAESVVIVSQTLATRLFGAGEVLNRNLTWTDPVMRFIGVRPTPRRIIGIVSDLDDEHIVPREVMMVYHPFEQMLMQGRLFVQTHADPYPLVPSIVRVVRELSADQPVEKAASLDDIRAEVLTPDRLNAAVFGLFAVVALAIAVIGVAGVLAFSVSSRTREFGIRIALGSMPAGLLKDVVKNGLAMALAGIAVGIAGGFVAVRVAAYYLENVQSPGILAVIAAGAVLLVAGVAASLVPALRAARTNVIEALRAD